MSRKKDFRTLFLVFKLICQVSDYLCFCLFDVMNFSKKIINETNLLLALDSVYLLRISAGNLVLRVKGN